MSSKESWMYKVLFDKRVLKDLKRIDKQHQKEIIEAIEKKLAQDPYVGKRLLGDLSGLYRYRVGKYRIIYAIYEERIEIEVIKVGHRREIYKK